MPRYNIMQSHKAKANQLELSSKHLKIDQFIEEESFQEKMDRFFKSIGDTDQKPSQNQVSETYKQTDDQNAHSFIQSKATSDSDDSYYAKINYHFARLENLCKKQQVTDTPTVCTPAKITDVPTAYIHPMCMPSIYTPVSYPAYYYTYPWYPGYVYYGNYNGACQGATNNNHTDYEDCNKYIADV